MVMNLYSGLERERERYIEKTSKIRGIYASYDTGTALRN
jgi:hypothetical protein